MPKITQYKKGAVVYFKGDYDERIFILQQGLAVGMTVDIGSKLRINERIRAGEFFGVKSALGQFPREETVSIEEDAVCISMTVPEFETMFASNTQIIMKMLRVFSGQLRQVHRKTESILHKDDTINQESGMLAVAQAFYDDGYYRSCCDVCLSFLKRYPDYPGRLDVAKLYTSAKLKAQSQVVAPQKKVPEKTYESYDEEAYSYDEALRQFDLPAFQRFAKLYEPGQVIICEYEPGDSFYLIQSGNVRLVKCVNGTNKNLDILRPGEFFGEMAILDNSPRSATCLAADDVKCLAFNKANFDLLVTGNPKMAIKLLKLFCKRIYDQKHRLKILTIADLPTRVAEVLVLLEEMSQNTKRSDKRRVDTTINDIARWAGLPADTTRYEIDKYVTRKKIQVYDTYIIINSITDMKRLASSSQISRE